MIDYVLSGGSASEFDASTVEILTARINQALTDHGAIHITKDAGLFEATK